jgi:hypothetical protein
MRIKQFETDLDAIRARFNQTFQDLHLCNPDFRVRVVFAIVHMGILQKRINTQKRREDIREFLAVRDKMNKIFTAIDKEKRKEVTA